LGGYEGGKYRLGDEVRKCLQDLKKLWRKDDTDDERTVARILWDARVLPNDLVPILLATAGAGLVEDKRAISCVDLMAAMTWPIDMAEELKELDDELDKGTDYTQLLLSHLNYKAALLKPGVMQALLGIVLPPISKNVKERTPRDGQIVGVVLHLIRNLAFIKDPPANTHLSSDQVEYSSLQTKLVKAISETRISDLLLTIAANSGTDPWFNSWNTLVLEIIYLLFRGVKPSTLSEEQVKVRLVACPFEPDDSLLQHAADNLHRLLAKEETRRRNFAFTAPSRHSRFGTTISISLNSRRNDGKDPGGSGSDLAVPSQALVFHRQRALDREAGGIIDSNKRQKGKKANKIDELTREDNLSVEARGVLQNLATEFVQSCFNRAS
jgi:replication fork protection complex subunit Tof1/Swi1